MELQEFIDKVTIAHNDKDCCITIDAMYEYRECICDCAEHDYKQKIQNISDIGLRYILEAMIDELRGGTSYGDMYRMAADNGCAIAMYKLGMMYDWRYVNTPDVERSMYYYWKYYDTVNDMKTFLYSDFISNDPKKFKQFMKSHFAMASANEQMREQHDSLLRENERMRERITELEYAPGGVGYCECKAHFESLAESDSKSE